MVREELPSDARYHSKRWKRERADHLADNPLCHVCLDLGRVVPANVVDHHIPVRQGADFWDRSNWRSMCQIHHQEKRNAERGTINYDSREEFKP